MQPLRLVGQQQACVTGNLNRWGKAQVNTAALWPMWAARGCRQRVGWRGPRGLRERKGSIQHKDVPDTDGKAKSQLLQLSSRQMARISLSFQRGGPTGPQRSTDPQVAAQLSGQGGWSSGCSNPQGEGRRAERTIAERREAGGKSHASFNRGISSV